MNADQRRLARLRRLERLRGIAKQAAAAEAAAAEGALAQLELLAARTRAMAGSYGVRRQASDGASLRQLLVFTDGLNGITRNTEGDAARAREAADAKMAELAQAERRRAATEERAEAQARRLVKSDSAPTDKPRGPLGTALE
jgi:hypothetical protein